MNPVRRAVPSLGLLCGSVLLMSACATTAGGLTAVGVQRATQNGPTKAECAELPALVTRLNRLERERARVREHLATAGFERTAAEAFADGTAPPGLALEAARSADALETMLAGHTPVYPGLNGEIDWIAANWFDPTLMRWTPKQIRTLTSFTADEFRDLKAETVGLRAMLPDLASLQRRQVELKDCGPRRLPSDEARSATTAVRAPSPRDAASIITCRPSATTKVNCQETVVVEAGDVAAALRPLNSSSMSRDELRGLGPDASAWMAFARNAAGAPDGAERVYVDGMPAVASVPASMIGRITVNGDPFSAEYSKVGELRVDIALLPVERRWRVGLSSPSFGSGGGSPLGPMGQPISRNTSMSVSGPVPRLPLTFSAQASQRLDARRPLFVAPVSGALALAADDLQTTSTSTDLLTSAAFVTSRAVARATFSDSRMQADHAGIGGTNGPTTGQRLDSRNQRLQASWRVAAGGGIHRGGLTFTRDRLSAVADSTAPLMMLTEQFVTGGDELATNARRSVAWAVKHVVEAGTWTAGVEGRSERVADERVPNPQGRVQFTAMDARTATWIVSRGRASAAVRETSAALFVEHLTVNTPLWTMRSGLRMDWQDRAGALVSPRVVVAARVSGVQLSGGAGLFVQSWSPDLFVLAAERAGTESPTFVVHDVPGGSIERVSADSGERLRTAFSSVFERRRDLIVRAGIQRRVGPLQTGVEHTWTRGESLSGAERTRDAVGLVDVISSDRSLRRQQTHVRSSLRRGTDSISAYYEHTWSFDDSDGPWMSPARQGDVGGEWAPSAGVARHAAGLTGATRLPAQIQVFLSMEARSGSAYTVFSGSDPEGLAVFTDRGGRPRNTGRLPSFQKVSLSLSRTVRIPRAAWLVFDVGVRADNLTNHLNVMSVGRVIGTSGFGLPIDATAGRSIRFWMTLAR